MAELYEHLRLSHEDLRPKEEPDWLPFRSTKELVPRYGPIGQERALAAIDVGLGIEDPTFHLFVCGEAGTGRTSGVRTKLSEVAAQKEAPDDCCYLYNFRDPDHPKAIFLPAGRGRELADDLDRLVEGCRTEIPKAFESEPFRKRRMEIHERWDMARQQLMEKGDQRTRQLGFGVEIGPSGFAIVPLRDGQPMLTEDVQKLPDKDQKALRSRAERVRSHVEQTLRAVRKLQLKEANEASKLVSEVARYAAGHLIDEVAERYKGVPQVQEHLSAIRDDLGERFQEFIEGEGGGPGAMPVSPQRKRDFIRYRANVFVDNRGAKGAPVIFERNPTYYNLCGKVDYQAEFGALLTNFTMVKPGALQRANGGYLVLDALDVLMNPYAWQALIRALRGREIAIENLAEQYGLVSSATLKPEAIPLSVRVILIGERNLYHLLLAVDKNFAELFRIKADFDNEVPRSADAAEAYARYISMLGKQHGMRPFDAPAVAKVLAHGSRLREHQHRLSASMQEIYGLAAEATYWAKRDGSAMVRASHVSKAIAEKETRSKLIEDKFHQQIMEETVFVDVSGEVVGQVNGLSVYDLGDYAFARPVRVTARTSLGAQGIVDIEREVDLSGKIHSKAVLILGSYLAHKFAQDKPLALSASLTFEQSYGMVEGDSATLAELYAILSSLANLPVKQGIAVTGSMNQRGTVQPVGGVTLKIEGFFKVCADRGLTGEQGVVIPFANVKNLALKEEVVQAVKDRLFHIWAIKDVGEALEILTGVAAGEQDLDGRYAEGTVNSRVDHCLRRFADRLQDFGSATKPTNGQRKAKTSSAH